MVNQKAQDAVQKSLDSVTGDASSGIAGMVFVAIDVRTSAVGIPRMKWSLTETCGMCRKVARRSPPMPPARWAWARIERP